MNKFMAITGPMGVGKTTLGRTLSNYLGMAFIPESFQENPYLSESTDNDKNSFENILWFIKSDFARYRHACALLDEGVSVIVDKPFHEEYTYIAMAGLTNDQRNICRLYVDNLARAVRTPDLLLDLTLDPNALIGRIVSRGREFESGVESSWLARFIDTHNIEMQRWPEMRRINLDSSRLDFRNQDSVKSILEVI